MAKISDGTTEISMPQSDDRVNPGIEKSTKRTAGRELRSTVGGEVFKMSVRSRATPAVFRTVIDLLKNGSPNYFFTPEEEDKQWLADLYPDVSYPLNANFSNLGREWDNRNAFYITYDVESTSYV